ncbi:hypothetical protein [Lentzea nigeriaca]|uniref:hypothetical protein n=1 Tax=Lentzea nigeriaca TaxID=1128665 RepID=UPI00195C55FA|nr:hypothetical protein [Lentzea nigeriaca]MBM7862543.1 hypothetical protein [Lentzea nigeriaca]
MKRWIWPVVAVVAAAVGVVVWLRPSSVDVTLIRAIHPDGTIEWVEAEYRKAPENNSAAYSLTEFPHVSKLAQDAEFRTAQGCGTLHDISLGWGGLGTVACSREEFLALDVPPYAPRLTFNSDGEITEVAGRYHP